METKKRKLHKEFNPEKYKMVCCPYCGGTGKLSTGGKESKVCNQCGGFGWIKKGEGKD
jgi:hypothetical protein